MTSTNVTIRLISLDTKGKNIEFFALYFLQTPDDTVNQIHRVLEEGGLQHASRNSGLKFHV